MRCSKVYRDAAVTLSNVNVKDFCCSVMDELLNTTCVNRYITNEFKLFDKYFRPHNVDLCCNWFGLTHYPENQEQRV